MLVSIFYSFMKISFLIFRKPKELQILQSKNTVDKGTKARKNALPQLLDDADLTDEDWKQEEEEPVPRKEAEASSGEDEEAKSKSNAFYIS